MTQICDCGSCLTCKSRERGRQWREAHPGAKAVYRQRQREQRAASPSRKHRARKGRYIHPTESRMDQIAEQVWARFARPEYYAPAAERFRGLGATAGVMRVEGI